jgi:hypothetical protein
MRCVPTQKRVRSGRSDGTDDSRTAPRAAAPTYEQGHPSEIRKTDVLTGDGSGEALTNQRVLGRTSQFTTIVLTLRLPGAWPSCQTNVDVRVETCVSDRIAEHSVCGAFAHVTPIRTGEKDEQAQSRLTIAPLVLGRKESTTSDAAHTIGLSSDFSGTRVPFSRLIALFPTEAARLLRTANELALARSPDRDGYRAHCRA